MQIMNNAMEDLQAIVNSVPIPPKVVYTPILLGEYLGRVNETKDELFDFPTIRLTIGALESFDDLLDEDIMMVALETYLLQNWAGDDIPLYQSVKDVLSSTFHKDTIEKTYGGNDTMMGLDNLEEMLRREPILDDVILLGWKDPITAILLRKEY